MSIRGVIFDIGGVLERTPRTGWEDRWCETLGLTRGQLDARLEPVFLAGSTGHAALPEVEKHIEDALGLDHVAVARLMDDLWEEYLGTLNDELMDYFLALRSRYRTAMLSNSFVGAREREQARYGLANMCEVIIYSHEEGLMKPDACLYRIACKRLALRPEDCVFLDDVQVNVEGAWSVGMHAITFNDNDQAMRELNDLLSHDS